MSSYSVAELGDPNVAALTLIQLVGQGLTDGQIAERLGVPTHRISLAIRTLLKRFGITSRNQLVSVGIGRYQLACPDALRETVAELKGDPKRLSEGNLTLLRRWLHEPSRAALAKVYGCKPSGIDTRLKTVAHKLGRREPNSALAIVLWAELIEPYVPEPEGLTGTDRRILAGLIRSESYATIGGALGVDDRKVDRLRKAVLQKLGARTNVQAIGAAIRGGMLTVEEDVPTLCRDVAKLQKAPLLALDLRIVQALTAGYDRGEVAKAVGLTPNQLLGRLRNIYRRLDVSSDDATVAVVLWAGETHAPEPPSRDMPGLTPTERAVLYGMAAGQRQKTLARHLGITLRQLRHTLSHDLYPRIEARNTNSALGKVIPAGWLPEPDSLSQVRARLIARGPLLDDEREAISLLAAGFTEDEAMTHLGTTRLRPRLEKLCLRLGCTSMAELVAMALWMGWLKPADATPDEPFRLPGSIPTEVALLQLALGTQPQDVAREFGCTIDDVDERWEELMEEFEVDSFLGLVIEAIRRSVITAPDSYLAAANRLVREANVDDLRLIQRMLNGTTITAIAANDGRSREQVMGQIRAFEIRLGRPLHALAAAGIWTGVLKLPN
ncbi:MAG TPA: hypothetical protein VLF67_03535 [Candidatus Saccharimonas sp.]|nr:hypothetical protein [Candidatus Saccharimonas sp.]